MLLLQFLSRLVPVSTWNCRRVHLINKSGLEETCDMFPVCLPWTRMDLAPRAPLGCASSKSWLAIYTIINGSRDSYQPEQKEGTSPLFTSVHTWGFDSLQMVQWGVWGICCPVNSSSGCSFQWSLPSLRKNLWWSTWLTFQAQSYSIGRCVFQEEEKKIHAACVSELQNMKSYAQQEITAER